MAVLALLLERGADVNAFPQGHRPALCHAIEKGFDQVVKLLLQHGARTRFSRPVVGEFSALRYASGLGQLAVVEVVLRQCGAEDINDQGVVLGTALHLASQAGSEAVVELLLQAGADPTVLDDQGQTPRQVAQRKGHEDVADLLKVSHALV